MKRLSVPPGTRFGSLTVLSDAPNRVYKNGAVHRMVFCRCDCGGGQRAYLLTNLRRRPNTSCGCSDDERVKTMAKTHLQTHGQSFTPTYKAWMAMKNRCLSTGNKSYPRYGGRGITVFPEWIASFEAFASYMGPQPEGLTLDRIDNDGNYEPGNCRWATMKQQGRNRSSNRLVECDGRVMTVVEACELTGFKRHTIDKNLAKTGEFHGVRLHDDIVYGGAA